MLNSSNVIHPNTHNSGPLTSEVATSDEAAGQVLGTAKPGAARGTGLPSLPQLGQGEQLGDSTGISHPSLPTPSQERLHTWAGAFLQYQFLLPLHAAGNGRVNFSPLCTGRGGLRHLGVREEEKRVHRRSWASFWKTKRFFCPASHRSFEIFVLLGEFTAFSLFRVARRQ